MVDRSFQGRGERFDLRQRGVRIGPLSVSTFFSSSSGHQPSTLFFILRFAQRTLRKSSSKSAGRAGSNPARQLQRTPSSCPFPSSTPTTTPRYLHFFPIPPSLSPGSSTHKGMYLDALESLGKPRRMNSTTAPSPRSFLNLLPFLPSQSSSTFPVTTSSSTS